MLKMKKIFKFSALFIVVGICAFYTYQFVVDNTKLDNKSEVVSKNSETKGDAVAFQTASTEKMQNLDIGWERVRYSFVPSLQELTWTEVNNDYIVGVEDVSYRVTNASIQKEWNPKWNFEVVKDDYDFEENKSIKGKKSFVSVSVKLKNIGQSTCECNLNCIGLHIYDENGEKIMSSEVATASLDKPNTKNYYFEKLKSKKKVEADLVYIIQDKYLKDGYYYFIDVLPWSVYPKTKEEIGIFKLPLGTEGK